MASLITEMHLNVGLWLFDGETCPASKAVAFAACNAPSDYRAVPDTPQAFNRCLKLIYRVPEVRYWFSRVEKISPEWKKLISQWDTIEHCFVEEVGVDWSKSEFKFATQTQALLNEIVAEQT